MEPHKDNKQLNTNQPVPEQPGIEEEMGEEELDRVSGGTSSTGAGAGKVIFNPFSITKHVDKSTPVLFL